ncbi:ATP-binding cassette domain-containing protein [Holdemania filiformis]|uniref:ATP-binding cassette domain-containing protein n=1 Tax=Holdemania filiformis TaxID=61171 RepID=UPI0022E621CB|nr:ABC transporter ATP-binding protein [Holdemania filiformis]
MEMMLTVQDLTKRYHDFKALDHFSMNVEKGAIYGFVGRNGAGKTTLIRTICGLQAPSQGTYTLLGRKHNDPKIAKSRRKMGAVIETPSLYRELNARENLEVQLRMLGLAESAEIDRLLALVGLSEAGRKKVKDFSLGMRQRLAMAVALAGDPDFLVLDEPVNGLDPQGIIEVRELILKLNQKHQVTVMISSHNLDELARLATVYGFIDHGRMVKEIAADELEKTCRKCVELSVGSPEAAVETLESIGVDYRVTAADTVEVYGEIGLSDLLLKLAKNGCAVLSMKARDESLESYYLSLVGGRDHE